MIYVARHTPNPQGDAERGWSAWGGSWGTLAHALDCVEPLRQDDESDEEFAERMIDEEIIREWNGMYAVHHHDGLACYELEAETEGEAEVVFLEMFDDLTGHTGGCIGLDCQYVRPLPREGWHLFQAADTEYRADIV